MTSRRAFLMMAISATAVGAVAVVTSRLHSDAQPAQPPPPAAENAQAGEPQAEAQGQVQGAPAEAAQLPAFVSRDQWGAEPPQVFAEGRGENGPYDPVSNPDGWLVYDQPLEELLELVILHHSALPLSDGPREIQKLHTEEFGFADIGYQYLINETGQTFEGRAMNVRGAHTLNFNFGSIGICLIGNFEEITPTAEQLGALDGLLNELLARYPGITRLAGHKDFNPGRTLCPGQNFHPLLPGIAAAHGLTYTAG